MKKKETLRNKNNLESFFLLVKYFFLASMRSFQLFLQDALIWLIVKNQGLNPAGTSTTLYSRCVCALIFVFRICTVLTADFFLTEYLLNFTEDGHN